MNLIRLETSNSACEDSQALIDDHWDLRNKFLDGFWRCTHMDQED